MLHNSSIIHTYNHTTPPTKNTDNHITCLHIAIETSLNAVNMKNGMNRKRGIGEIRNKYAQYISKQFIQICTRLERVHHY